MFDEHIFFIYVKSKRPTTMIPESLQYFAERLAGLSRNTVAIQSQSGTTMATNGNRIVRFSFPNSSIVDLQSFAIEADCATSTLPEDGGNNNRVAGLIPSGGIRAMLERVSFSCGGVSLTNDVAPLGVISRMKDNLGTSFDKAISDQRVLEAQQLQSKTAVNDDPQTRKCVATRILGFCQAAPRYFDCSLAPQIYVQCTLAGNENIPLQYEDSLGWAPLGTLVGSAPGAVQSPANAAYAAGQRSQFTATNIKASIDVISLATGMYQQMVQDLMAERGSLVVAYPAYNTFQAAGAANATVRGSLSTSNLHKLYAVSRLTEAGAATDFQGQAIPAQAASYTVQQLPVIIAGDNVGNTFMQATHCFTGRGVTQWRMRVNQAPFPLFDPDLLQSYVQAAGAEDRLGDDQRGGSVTSLAGWYGNQFAYVNRFSLDNDIRRLSGLDCSSINAALSLTSQGDTAANLGVLTRDYLMVAESTSRLMIGPGRAVSVVY